MSRMVKTVVNKINGFLETKRPAVDKELFLGDQTLGIYVSRTRRREGTKVNDWIYLRVSLDRSVDLTCVALFLRDSETEQLYQSIQLKPTAGSVVEYWATAPWLPWNRDYDLKTGYVGQTEKKPAVATPMATSTTTPAPEASS